MRKDREEMLNVPFEFVKTRMVSLASFSKMNHIQHVLFCLGSGQPRTIVCLWLAGKPRSRRVGRRAHNKNRRRSICGRGGIGKDHWTKSSPSFTPDIAFLSQPRPPPRSSSPWSFTRRSRKRPRQRSTWWLVQAGFRHSLTETLCLTFMRSTRRRCVGTPLFLKVIIQSAFAANIFR